MAGFSYLCGDVEQCSQCKEDSKKSCFLQICDRCKLGTGCHGSLCRCGHTKSRVLDNQIPCRKRKMGSDSGLCEGSLMCYEEKVVFLYNNKWIYGLWDSKFGCILPLRKQSESEFKICAEKTKEYENWKLQKKHNSLFGGDLNLYLQKPKKVGIEINKAVVFYPMQLKAFWGSEIKFDVDVNDIRICSTVYCKSCFVRIFSSINIETF